MKMTVVFWLRWGQTNDSYPLQTCVSSTSFSHSATQHRCESQQLIFHRSSLTFSLLTRCKTRGKLTRHRLTIPCVVVTAPWYNYPAYRPAIISIDLRPFGPMNGKIITMDAQEGVAPSNSMRNVIGNIRSVAGRIGSMCSVLECEGEDESWGGEGEGEGEGEGREHE